MPESINFNQTIHAENKSAGQRELVHVCFLKETTQKSKSVVNVGHDREFRPCLTLILEILGAALRALEKQ